MRLVCSERTQRPRNRPPQFLFGRVPQRGNAAVRARTRGFRWQRGSIDTLRRSWYSPDKNCLQDFVRDNVNRVRWSIDSAMSCESYGMQIYVAPLDDQRRSMTSRVMWSRDRVNGREMLAAKSSIVGSFHTWIRWITSRYFARSARRRRVKGNSSKYRKEDCIARTCILRIQSHRAYIRHLVTRNKRNLHARARKYVRSRGVRDNSVTLA